MRKVRVEVRCRTCGTTFCPKRGTIRLYCSSDCAPTTIPPSVQLVGVLADLRRDDTPFEEAWPLALRLVCWPHDGEHRASWKAVLAERDVVQAWRDAYERTGRRLAITLDDLTPPEREAPPPRCRQAPPPLVVAVAPLKAGDRDRLA